MLLFRYMTEIRTSRTEIEAQQKIYGPNWEIT